MVLFAVREKRVALKLLLFRRICEYAFIFPRYFRKFWRVEMHTRYCKDFLCAVPYIEGFTSMVEKRDTVAFLLRSLSGCYLGVSVAHIMSTGVDEFLLSPF